VAGSAATLFRTCTLSDDGYYLRIAGLLGSASLTVGSSTLTLQGIRDCMIATLDAATGEWVRQYAPAHGQQACMKRRLGWFRRCRLFVPVLRKQSG
jgi:hypothetical protein